MTHGVPPAATADRQDGGPDDPATVARVAAALPSGWRLEALASVGSTNDVAREAAEAGAAGGLVIWTGVQRAGRGRLGHGWESPAGNLYCSVLVRPAVPAPRLGEATFVAAVALADTLADRPGLPPITLKWPNDVLVGGAKIAGILLEGGGAMLDQPGWVAIGTGVNVASHPDRADYATTSLAAALDDPPGVADLLTAYVATLDRRLEAWQSQGFPPIRSAWLRRAAHLGDRITARLPSETLTGRFQGLDGDGHLLLALDDGATRTISAADVFFEGD